MKGKISQEEVMESQTVVAVPIHVERAVQQFNYF